LVGVASGYYIFGIPLKEYAEELKKNAPEKDKKSTGSSSPKTQ
jgi:hypothetical protein